MIFLEYKMVETYQKSDIRIYIPVVLKKELEAGKNNRFSNTRVMDMSVIQLYLLQLDQLCTKERGQRWLNLCD